MVGGTVTLNKMLINSFVAFFCLHRPFVASYLNLRNYFWPRGKGSSLCRRYSDRDVIDIYSFQSFIHNPHRFCSSHVSNY